MGNDCDASDIYRLSHFLNVHHCADNQSHLLSENATSVLPWFDDDTNLPGSPSNVKDFYVWIETYLDYTIWCKMLCNTSNMAKWPNLNPTGVLVPPEMLYNHGIFQLPLTHIYITQSIWSSRLPSVPPCCLWPPVLSNQICLACWMVVIYWFHCTKLKTKTYGDIVSHLQGLISGIHFPVILDSPSQLKK